MLSDEEVTAAKAFPDGTGPHLDRIDPTPTTSPADGGEALDRLSATRLVR